MRRYEVTKQVSFPETYDPKVWGRGVATLGWGLHDTVLTLREPEKLNCDDPAACPCQPQYSLVGSSLLHYSMGWCAAVPGTLTERGATLRTYVYEVFSDAGPVYGWWPCRPESVYYAYTVFGHPIPFGKPGRGHEESLETTLQLSLGVNYPNPFNPATTISFELNHDVEVQLVVYDVFGRVVATLVDGVQPAGEHKVTWAATGVASGVYFCRLRSGPLNITRKMLVVK